MNEFSWDQYEKICMQFGNRPPVRKIKIPCRDVNFFYKMKQAIAKDRWGEIAFGVIRPDGNMVLVTCDEYPQGIFRIPTGGIGHQEDVGEALYREVKEELGVEVECVGFMAVLHILFTYEEEEEYFYSYLFVMRETGGCILKDAIEDEISEIMEVGLAEYEQVITRLEHIPSDWYDWGQFRLATSREMLREICQTDAIRQLVNR